MGFLLDIAIIAIIAVAAFLGWRRGFVKTAINSASGFISLVVAFILCRPVSNFLSFTEIPESLKIAISFVILYIASKLILFLLSNLLTKLIDFTFLRTVNKSLGVVLSVLLSFLNVIVFCFIVNAVFDAAELFGNDIFASINRENTVIFQFISKIDIFSLIL